MYDVTRAAIWAVLSKQWCGEAVSYTHLDVYKRQDGERDDEDGDNAN